VDLVALATEVMLLVALDKQHKLILAVEAAAEQLLAAAEQADLELL
tara:strand:+ start:398 stop:535 length:138 start_codon:yes stop_codon:yes gene_type:complete